MVISAFEYLYVSRIMHLKRECLVIQCSSNQVLGKAVACWPLSYESSGPKLPWCQNIWV